MEKFEEQGAVIKSLNASKVIRIILVLNTSINHPVKFVYGHMEAFIQISRGNCITDQIEDLTLNILNAPC